MSRARSMARTVGIPLALLAFGFVSALIALEIVLQGAALYARWSVRPVPTIASSTRPKVMCLGDSNTFGIYLPRDQTYPHYLERIWNAGGAERPIEMLNFGFPGLNSSKLRKNLPGLLESFRPELVLILVGANDPISVAVPIDDETKPSVATTLWRSSRVFRFFYMLARGAQVYRLDYRRDDRVGSVHVDGRDFDLLGTERTSFSESEAWKRDLESNLIAMVRAVRASGAQAVLLTYASHQLLYGMANEAARAAANAADLPIIDADSDFRLICPSGRCPQIFFGDQHPNALGYELFAAIAWRDLHRLTLAPGDDVPHALAQLDPKTLEMFNRLGGTVREATSPERSQF